MEIAMSEIFETAKLIAKAQAEQYTAPIVELAALRRLAAPIIDLQRRDVVAERAAIREWGAML